MQNIMKCLWVVLVFSGIDEIPELIGLQLLWDETKLLKSLGCSFLSAQRFILAQVQSGASTVQAESTWRARTGEKALLASAHNAGMLSSAPGITSKSSGMGFFPYGSAE